MKSSDSRPYDLAIIGAGPVGSLCALAHARKGAKVALFEANPEGNNALKGEWLHPPAARILQRVGVHFDTEVNPTNGFVMFPEDGSEPIPIKYPEGSQGLVVPHETLVLRLREAVNNEPNIDLVWERVRPTDDGSISYMQDGIEKSVTADRIVGADGRGSIVLRLLGLTERPTVISRIIGVKLDGVSLPMEGYGQIICSELGPMFMYQLGEGEVAAIVDVPREYTGDQATGLLLESYAPLLPEPIRAMFVEAVQEGNFRLAGNTVRPRISYGNSRFVVIGDAAGHYHPMTAVGLTLGFGDAMGLAESENFDAFVAQRFREIRASEMLALGFYEVFADNREEVMALRHAVYGLWRKGGRSADRSVRLLACEDTSETSLGFVGAIVVAMAVARIVPRSIRPRSWRLAASNVRHLFLRIGWFIRAVWQLRKSRVRGDVQNEEFHFSLAHAFLLSEPDSQDHPRQSSH